MSEPKRLKGSLPAGYSFVPKGNVYVTSNCRKLTQARGSPVYMVVDAKNQQIGIGVPTKIYVGVQYKERSTRAERAANVAKRDEGIANGFQKEIMKIFPNIPADALRNVAKMATQKGKGKVGRVGKLDAQRKARLAVWAHVRHCETDYDALLRMGVAREDARQQVEAKIKEIYNAWGGGDPQMTHGRTRKNSQSLARSNVKSTKTTKEAKEQPNKNAKTSSSMTVTTHVASPKSSKPAVLSTNELDAVFRNAKRAQRQKQSPKAKQKDTTQQGAAPKASSTKVVVTAASFREKRTLQPRVREPVVPTPPKTKPRWVVPEMPEPEDEARSEILRLIARVGKKQRQHDVTRLCTIARRLKLQINEILEDASFQRIKTSTEAREDLAKRLRRMVQAPKEDSG